MQLSLLGVYLKELKARSQEDICTHVYSCIIHNRRRVAGTQSPPPNEWINTMQYICTVQYQLALKREISVM